MSDTPRTDQASAFLEKLGVMDALEYAVYHAEKLERELSEANERIKRLKDSGDALAHNHNPFTFIDWMKARDH